MVRFALVAVSVAGLASLGCGTALASDSTSLSPSAVGAAGQFELRLDEVDRIDRLFEVEVFGAPAGSTIFFAVSSAIAGERACPDNIAPVCVGLSEPVTLIEESRVDSDGEAWTYVPWSMAQGTGAMEVQAWTLDSAGTSWVSNALRLNVP